MDTLVMRGIYTKCAATTFSIAINSGHIEIRRAPAKPYAPRPYATVAVACLCAELKRLFLRKWRGRRWNHTNLHPRKKRDELLEKEGNYYTKRLFELSFCFFCYFRKVMTTLIASYLDRNRGRANNVHWSAGEI